MVTFLAWAAEPKMEERKHIGFGVMLFLIAFRSCSILLSPRLAGRH